MEDELQNILLGIQMKGLTSSPGYAAIEKKASSLSRMSDEDLKKITLEAKRILQSERPAAKGITIRKAKEEPRKVALDPISEEIAQLYSQVSGTAAFDAKDRELGLSVSFRNLAELNPIKKRRLLNELIKLSELKPNLRGSFQPAEAKTSPIFQSNLDLLRGIRLSMIRLVCALYADPPKPKATRRPS